MISFPFSPVGVETMLTQLYTLQDTALSVQAKTVKIDFKLCVRDHFTLTENQLSFLEAVNEDVSIHYGEQCSFCFTHCLEIKLISPMPPEVPGYAKWIGSQNTIVVKGDGTGENVISGTLTFTISYG